MKFKFISSILLVTSLLLLTFFVVLHSSSKVGKFERQEKKRDVIAFDLVSKLGTSEERIHFEFPSEYRIVLPEKARISQKFFTLSIHYLTGRPYSRTKGSPNDEIFIVVSTDEYDKKKINRIFDTLPDSTKNYLKNRGNERANEKLDIQIEAGESTLVGFFYDKNLPVMFIDRGNWSKKYSVERMLSEKVVIRYAYDKNINASYTEIDNFVVNFIKHQTNNTFQ